MAVMGCSALLLAASMCYGVIFRDRWRPGKSLAGAAVVARWARPVRPARPPVRRLAPALPLLGHIIQAPVLLQATLAARWRQRAVLSRAIRLRRNRQLAHLRKVLLPVPVGRSDPRESSEFSLQRVLLRIVRTSVFLLVSGLAVRWARTARLVFLEGSRARAR